MAHPIVLAGTLAGVLDILAAFALSAARGGSPVRVLQGIASGLLGPPAFQGGATTALLGLALHFFIAFVAAALYYAASKAFPVLVRRAILFGLAYGVVVYVFMNEVILPLSRITFRRAPWHIAATLVIIHMLCVGLPIALVVRRAAPTESAGDACR